MIRSTHIDRERGQLVRGVQAGVRRFPAERHIAERGRGRSPCVAAARREDALRSESHGVRQIRTQRPHTGIAGFAFKAAGWCGGSRSRFPIRCKSSAMTEGVLVVRGIPHALRHATSYVSPRVVTGS